MGYTAQWGPKGFLVSPSKIVPFNNFSTSIALKMDNGNDTSGTGASNTRGRELQSMSFTTTYLTAAGVDPRKQLEEWEAEIGKAYPLYIGNQRFGPAKMMLVSLDVSDLLMSDSGEFLSLTLSINMQEYSENKETSIKSAAASAAASKAATTYSKTVEKKKAINATATSSDKVAKKLAANKGVLMY